MVPAAVPGVLAPGLEADGVAAEPELVLVLVLPGLGGVGVPEVVELGPADAGATVGAALGPQATGVVDATEPVALPAGALGPALPVAEALPGLELCLPSTLSAGPVGQLATG